MCQPQTIPISMPTAVEFADDALVEPNTPVLVGCGQLTERSHSAEGSTPAKLLAESARLALQDAMQTAANPDTNAPLYRPDALAMVRLVFDTQVDADARLNLYQNPPGAVARHLNLSPSQLFYSEGGGSSPQRLVNEIASRIAAGEMRSAVLVGGEALSTQHARFVAGLKEMPDPCDWGEFETLGRMRAGGTEEEIAHGLGAPARVYPLFANALRRHYGQSVPQHMQACAQLFSGFSARAADNPHAWFQTSRSEDEIASVSRDNRWVSAPYTKYMNAIMRVNMAASVVMMSWQEAQRLGIARSHCVFLHGCSQASEIWNVSERVNYHSAPAIKANVNQAMQMAGIGTDDLSFMDIYSCFPCAVQIACDEIGIAHDDPRGLTLTGGLPYFGGPGNNYAMHSIAEALLRLRQNPEHWGLVTANGWYLTKHGTGVYSSRPFRGSWQAPDYAAVQREIDTQPHPNPKANAEGEVSIETYTVSYGRDGAERGIVIGRTANGDRVLANVPAENQALLLAMTEEDWLDRRGCIRQSELKGKKLGIFEETG